MPKQLEQKQEKALHIKIPKEMHDDLHTLSRTTGAPIAEIVRRAIRARYYREGELLKHLLDRLLDQ